MSDINFLANNKEPVKIKKPADSSPAVKWTEPGTLPKSSPKTRVEDIFAEADSVARESSRQLDDALPSVQTETLNSPGFFSAFKNFFKKDNSAASSHFKKNKEELRDYQESLNSEKTMRNGDYAQATQLANSKKEVGAKTYFRRDQWQAPNVIKTNLIQKEINSSLDWRDNINMLLLGVASAGFLLVVFYLGLELKESFAVQKNQEIVQQIQDTKMEIVNLKSGLGDIDTFQKKLSLASSLLAKHIYWTNFFKFWEDNLLKDVYFSGDFSGDINGKYTFLALTNSYASAANQIRLLRETNSAKGFIKEMTVNQASYSAGEKQAANKAMEEQGAKEAVDFDLSIKMDQKIFYKND